MTETSKVCNTCRELKPHNSFHTSRASKDGVTSKCKACQKEYDHAKHLRTYKPRPPRLPNAFKHGASGYRAHKCRCGVCKDGEAKLKARWNQTRQGKAVARVAWMNRAAYKRGAAGRASQQQIAARIDFYGGCCYLCGVKADTIDHVIPLSRGGSAWPSNLRPACRGCNFRKHNFTLQEYLAKIAA